MFLRGEDINIGIGVESTRGTGAAPTVFIPGRTPAGINVDADKILIKETRATKTESQGSEITRLSAGGNLEFNLRISSICYLLKSLLGDAASEVASGETAVYKHTFGILQGSPQHPSLTLALSKPGIQDYEYPLTLVKSLEIRTPVKDLINATAGFISQKESAHADYSPLFENNDYYFRHFDASVKLATNLAGLAAATPLKLKDFKLTIDNKGRFNQNISELYPSDVLATLFNFEGEMELDLQNTDLHDAYTSGSYKALELNLTRSDITIGNASNPSVSITLPKISFESYNESRKIDDIVQQSIKFVGHYSEADGKAIECVIINEKENYDS